MPFADAATGYRIAARKRGAAAALSALGVTKKASWWGGVSNAASKGIQSVGKASRFASKLTGTLPTGIGNMISAGLGVVGEGIGNVASARPGLLNKTKAALGGAVSGLSGSIPGLGWVLPSMMTTGMNKAMGVKMAAGEADAAPSEGGLKQWRNYLPLAGAAAGGLGAYAYMRHPEKAVAPYLKKMRALAAEGYTRPTDLRDSPVYDLIKGGIKRNRTTNSYEMPWHSKMLTRLVHGDGAVPIIGARDGSPKFYPKGVDRNVRPKGLVMEDEFLTRAFPGSKKHNRWEHEGPKGTRKFVKDIESSKDRELKFMEKHAPGLSPERVEVSKLLANTKGTPEQRIEQFHAALKKVRKAHGYDDIMLKPVDGFQSDGLFPRARKLKKQWAQYTEALKNPKLRRDYEAAVAADRVQGADPASLVHFLKDKDLYEGHALHRALQDPNILMGQRFVPGHSGELRVHTIGGELMPHGTLPRNWYKQSLGDTLAQMRHTRAAHAVAQEALSKMPAKARHGSYGMDIATFKHPRTGEVSHKIVELNPANEGAQSGFLSAHTGPFGENALERHMTGRWSKPISAIGGAAGAAGGGALGVAAKHLTAPKKEDPRYPAAPA